MKLGQIYCVVLLIALAFGSSNASINFPGTKKFVRIVNNLSKGERLNFHCQSKDNDIGVRSLAVNEQYEFSFRINIWRTTLFFCRLWYSDKHAEFVAFKVSYDFYQDCGNQDHCIWTAKEDGVYLKDELEIFWVKNSIYVCT
ncbi:putative plant self-incompatibility S1 [Rosa chinensis]|uniref:S-protein homolog n=1 Tax=Rosa chinensis TaxID=74649 RepID=A0A2P6R566_ROSCH|nr:putative plant self-incompatibility S1 [Rosa chinensis]